MPLDYNRRVEERELSPEYFERRNDEIQLDSDVIMVDKLFWSSPSFPFIITFHTLTIYSTSTDDITTN